MKRNTNVILIYFLMGLLVSCQPSEAKKEAQKQSPTQKVEKQAKNEINKKEKKKPERPFLTFDNADAFLLDYGTKNPEDKIVVKTKFGDIKIKLYHDTPIHRANMLWLAKNGFYKGNQFYRVIPQFMIQAGETDDQEVAKRRRTFGNYDLKAEILPQHFHRRGAVAMGRTYDDNPEKRSSAYNFYIVQGKVLTTWEINTIENTYMLKIPEAHREVYRDIGGSPHIDGDHTVFGEVYEGMAVVDSIAKLKTDKGHWPINSVYIDVEVLKD